VKNISVLLASLLVSLLLASAASAHEGHEHGETTMSIAQDTTIAAGTLAPSGGLDILLPTAALLLGGSVLCYAFWRRA
jgi:hydrogenase/urease accessory protein HupE